MNKKVSPLSSRNGRTPPVLMLLVFTVVSCTSKRDSELTAEALQQASRGACLAQAISWVVLARTHREKDSFMAGALGRKPIPVPPIYSFSKETDELIVSVLTDIQSKSAARDSSAKDPKAMLVVAEKFWGKLEKDHPVFVKDCSEMVQATLRECVGSEDADEAKVTACVEVRAKDKMIALKERHDASIASYKAHTAKLGEEMVRQSELRGLMASGSAAEFKKKLIERKGEAWLDRMELESLYGSAISGGRLGHLSVLEEFAPEVFTLKEIEERAGSLVARLLSPYGYPGAGAGSFAAIAHFLSKPQVTLSPEVAAGLSKDAVVDRAIKADSAEYVAALLRRKLLKPTTRNEWGHALIAQAVNAGAVNVVRMLLKRGVDPNSVSAHKRRVLAIAVDKKDVGMMNALLEGGADIHLKEYETFGDPILKKATEMDYPPILEVLRKRRLVKSS